jgi:hypothetical protein
LARHKPSHPDTRSAMDNPVFAGAIMARIRNEGEEGEI